MKILIYPSTGDGGNLGDLAMLKTTVARLGMLWPDARLQMLSTDRKALKIHFPAVELVPLRGCKRWFRVGALPRRILPDVPPAVRAHFPLTPGRFWRFAYWAYPPDYFLAREFANSLFNADLLVLAGCGLFTDEFPYGALRVLDIFAAAIRCGIPTVMFGQGFGPISGESLFKRAAEVLPHVGAIHLREQRTGLPLLKKLGVPEGKVVVTGDDAIEIAFRERRPKPGICIGVNLRLARYSAITTENLETVRTVLAEKTQQYQTRAMGIPILIGDADSDVQTMDHLLGKMTNDGRRACHSVGLPEVIRRVGECRLVVAGSYHAGVFALSQGIPVVAIAQSAYYRDKFNGLADQFGVGCIVLLADDAQFAGKLRAAIDQAWEQAETMRQPLLQAAEVQVRASRAAYEKLPSLLG